MTQPFRTALSARDGPLISTCALMLVALVPTPCPALVEVLEGNQPLHHFNDAAWPGLRAVVNDPSRVLFTSGPTTEETGYYRGDAKDFQRILEAFAATDLTDRIVILRPGKSAGWLWKGSEETYDWRLDVRHGDWGAPVGQEEFKSLDGPRPSLTVFVGGGLELERLRIPDGITLVGVDTLREQYLRGLRSRDNQIRGLSIGRLAELDPYGKDTSAMIEGLMTDDGVRRSAESTLAKLEERAADPPEVRASYARDERRIRELIVAWRYPWLEQAIAVAVGAAVALLGITVLVGGARRRRGAPAR